MVKRWLCYLAVLLGCLVFYWAYREWLAYILLIAAIGAPLLSLLISLPAMVKTRLQVRIPARVTAGEEAILEADPTGPKILPPWRVKLGLQHFFTGIRRKYRPGCTLPTEHCGQIRIRMKCARVYDHLGLFFLPLKAKKEYVLPILPVARKPAHIPDTSRKTGVCLRPRRGGGFSENHDLRLYRPGDSLQQIHWKMSAKTGKLILREPLETIHSPMLLRLDLCGSPEELDQKLGEMLFLGRYLLDKGLHPTLQVWTKQGLLSLPVTGEAELLDAMVQIVSSPKAESGSVLSQPATAGWWHYIGGESHEEA